MLDFQEYDGKTLGSKDYEDVLIGNKGILPYIYEPQIELISEWIPYSKVELKEVLEETQESFYDFREDKQEREWVVFKLLVPDSQKQVQFSKMVDSIVFIKSEERLILVTQNRLHELSERLRETYDSSQTFNTFVVSFIYLTLDDMFEDLKEVKKRISEIERSIQESGAVKPIFNEILQLKKYLIMLSSTYRNNERLIENFGKYSEHFFGDSKLKQNANDKLSDRMTTLKDMVDSYNQYLSSLDTMINNLSSYQLNEIMKVLTSISIILTIPTMVYGFWGINVPLPFEKLAYGFILVFLISLVISFFVWGWLKKRRLM
ncbi:magnesium transporter CorA family protein [Lactococcus taiwanensis]|uniref:magnesium transporter CorA family protein n=1 Tax=Lactococcus taiwanensis TaxID=1151742 RepID=UPI0019629D6B|nr:magnesium transporter CorA family protein [Lactococcus taiwanensis]QRZ11532.1 magnesium transporter CorA family protein [Lactococcus taiwanensis]